MTDDELKKEATEYAKPWKTSLAYVSVKEAYLAGAEPREKRIAELDKENGKLEGKLADLQSEYAELENFKNNEVKGLKDILEIVESENVRLIGKLAFIENTLNNRIAQLTITQLTKAKEIIEKLISQNRKLWVYSDVREEAEQLLKEIGE